MTSSPHSASDVPDGSGREPRRALILRIGALGDVLLTRRLAFSLSREGITCTVAAPARHASVLLGDPWIRTVLDCESTRFTAVFSGSWPEGLEGAFDLGLVISNSPQLFDAVGDAAERVIRIPPEPRRDDVSIALQWARHADAICEPFTGILPLLTTKVDLAVAPGATVIHPGSGSPSKNWPMDRFVELGRRLGGSGHNVAWIRGPAEASFPREPPGRVIDRPSLDVLAATLAHSTLFVGNDSGVSHLAAATGAPTVALFGPTNPAVWRPEGPRVSVASAPSGALGDVSLETVLEAADLTRLASTV